MLHCLQIILAVDIYVGLSFCYAKVNQTCNILLRKRNNSDLQKWT